MWGPLSVEYMTIVFSAIPMPPVGEQVTDDLVAVPHRVVVLRLPPPGPPMLSALVCVRKCIWVALNHTKNGVSAAFWRR